MVTEYRKNKAKEYLMKVRYYDIRIDDKISEINKLKELCEKITSAVGNEGVSGTKQHDKIGSCIARIVDLQQELDADIDTFVDKRNEVCNVLMLVSNNRQYDVLYKRYILYHKWEKIANDMGFKDIRSIYKLHGLALENFKKILNMN